MLLIWNLVNRVPIEQFMKILLISNGGHIEKSRKCKFGLYLIIFMLTYDLMYIYIDCFTFYYD